jgi:predicted  nucleic acid-binding Zn-ribbon protein
MSGLFSILHSQFSIQLRYEHFGFVAVLRSIFVMSQEVVQWLNQIKALERQIADLQAELAQSNASGDKWRQLYETEAQQRRQESVAMQAETTQLQTTIAQLQTAVVPTDVAQERDRLATSLATEKASHEQTRKDLTTALSDAMELLSKGKSRLPDAVE